MISYLGALFTGLVLALAYPKFDLFPLAFVALGLLLLLVKMYPGRGFRLGFLAGFSFFFLLLYWLTGVMTHFGGLPLPAAWGILALLSAYLALYLAVPVYLFEQLKLYEISVLNAFILAGLVVLFEYLRGFILGGFPWGLLGASQYRFLDLIQAADIGGVYLISFLVVLVNYALFALFADYRRAWPVEAVVLVIFLSFLVYGHLERQKDWPGMPFEVGLIQGNIPQDIKWDKAFKQASLKRYFELSEKAIRHGAQILIWPETAIPFYFFPDQGLGCKIIAWSQTHQALLLFGAPRLSLYQDRIEIHNSLFLVAKGRIKGVYDKQHLVPFGEYVPLENVFPFLRTFAVASGDYRPGPNGGPLRLSRHKVFGPLICFESIFPWLARKQVQKGATVLVVVTNDAWFGRSAGPYQHFAQAVFRAIENRRYVLRAANTGISGVISPTGEILCATKLEETTAPCAKAGFLSYLTVYTKYGTFFPLFYLFWAVLAIPKLIRSRRK